MVGRDPALNLESITAAYGDDPVLRGISLSVERGEVVGLVGPNGSGKTTVVRVASRALRPLQGRVRLGRSDPYALSAREAARLVAVVPQDLLPAFPFTVLEVVLMGRAPYVSGWGGGRPEDWERARGAMAATSVQHLADRPVDELSGGERQRVILAQALAQDAPVLLLDEPTTHLDIRHVLDLLTLVRRLAEREGTAVLAVLHDLNVAAVTCDRLIALHRGEVVAQGRPVEVVTSALLRDVYGVEADVAVDHATGYPTIRLGPEREPSAPSGRRVHVVGGAGRAAPLLRRFAEAGYLVSVGVLHGTDTDDAVAERLNLMRVSVPPFSEIDDGSAAECERLIARSDLLVVCDAPYGLGNVRNLRLALAAASAGVPTVVVQETPIEERDFTAGVATALWNDLCVRSTVVGGYEDVAADVGWSS